MNIDIKLTTNYINVGGLETVGNIQSHFSKTYFNQYFSMKIFLDFLVNTHELKPSTD